MNSENLLRENVVAYKLLGPQSEPVIAIANHFRLQLGICLLLLLAATYLLTKTHYKETLPARGVLETKRGMQTIISPATARVDRIHVNRGDRVTRGDVLASLSADVYDQRGASIHQENIRRLRIDRGLLLEQVQGQQLAQKQSGRWSKRAGAHVDAARENLRREAELLRVQIQLSDRNLHAMASLLESGNSASAAFDRQYRAHLELLGREQSLSQRDLQFLHERDGLDNSRRLAELDYQQSILGLRRELQAIDREIEAAENRTRFTVVAQDSGVVAELTVEAGKPVFVNQPLFYIKPEHDELRAAIYVPAAIAPKLAVGQTVLLRYDAFDYRLYGRQEATVIAVGQARLDPRDTVLPIAGINEPVFKVTARLKNDSVEGEPSYLLQMGSTLIADFVVADMSLLQFIFKPVLGLQGKVT